VLGIEPIGFIKDLHAEASWLASPDRGVGRSALAPRPALRSFVTTWENTLLLRKLAP
jgi:hypothetical protein